MIRALSRAAVLLAALAATILPTATAAQAGDHTTCPPGYVCAWSDRDFNGARKDMQYSNARWTWGESRCPQTGTWLNCASSVFNNGRECDVWLWSGLDYSGQALYLYRTSRLAFLNQNAGPSPVGSWEDIIKSNHWCRSKP